ncbi:MAG: antibiotic biosynthesis monooxygenase [Bacteroidia bacterium]|nr:antibiotic biosynthesis monooxygenase [Bacteroidia bacterium]
MIIRLVKMTFRPECTEDFVKIFLKYRREISNSPGCSHLDLLRDKQDPGVFFTLSHWDGEESLLAYRNSELFKIVWHQTKQLFASDPQAWSTVVAG